MSDDFDLEDSDGAAQDDDWETRRLCDDGNCIGVIGRDGRCKVCGRPAADLPTPEAEPQADGDSPAAQENAEVSAAPEAGDPSTGAPSTDPGNWESRRLCSDGNCIGVIGPDGRCKVCGRPAEDA